MLLVAQIFSAVVLVIHVYIVLLETVLFSTRGWKVFAIPKEHVPILRPALSNQGCYNFFLVAALLLGFFHPQAEVAKAFQIFGLASVAVAGIWGGVTVMRKILLIQTLPAVIALFALLLAQNSPSP